MHVTVPGVAAAPPTTGLVVSAARPDDPTDRWASGMAWVPERCAATYRLVPWCGPSDETHEADRLGAVYYQPPAVEFAHECSTMDGEPDRDMLRRIAEANTPFVVARELWGGTLTREFPHFAAGSERTNPHLASGDAEILTGTATPEVALGMLEQAAGEASGGQAVMIHLPRTVASQIRELRRAGNLLLTNNDNIVVADAGYPGTGPIVAGTAEVQTVTVTGAPTGGTFTLSYDGATTAGIPFDATAAQVQAALEALPNVEPGGVLVTGTAGGPWTVTFTDAGDVPQMTGSGAGLTGGTTPAVDVTTATEGTAAEARPGVWAYATSLVAVRMSDVQVTDADRDTVDRSTNTRTAWSSRTFAATFDPCVHFAVEVTIGS